MQEVLALLKYALASVALGAQALLALFVPHPPALSPILPTPPSSVATSTTTTKLFPTAANKVASATTTEKTKQGVKPAQKPSDSAGASQPGSAAASPQLVPVLPPPLPQSVVNEKARAALVNILCTTRGGGYLHPISGSGVMISGDGVVLTNAHIGQYFLLRDYLVKNNVVCVIRTGSPATPQYTAELLYLPPAWINANATQIAAQEGTGTGQHDYAFLRITGRTDASAKLPGSFPYLAMTLDEASQNEPVLLASYPAGFLDGITIERELYISSAISTVSRLFSFDDIGTPEVISVGSTVVSQAGSSGGAIVRMQDAALQALVATATIGDSTQSTASRDLYGITLSHINKSLQSQGQGGIKTLLTGDLAQKASDFANTIAPGELQQLIKALKK